MQQPFDQHRCAATQSESAGRSDDEPATEVSEARGTDGKPLLATIVREQVVPRLMLAHRLGTPATIEHGIGDAPTSAAVMQLSELAVSGDAERAYDEVERCMRAGCSHATVLIDLVGAAARRLGDEWLDDQRSFAEVTVGLGTLQRVIAMTRHRLAPPVAPVRGPVALVPAPGEQHVLGLQVVGDLMTQRGWDVEVYGPTAPEALEAVVAKRAILAVGITVSCSGLLPPLARTVRRLRKASLNRDLLVMVGGALELSDYAKDVGAIHCASARDAPAFLEHRARLCV
jgi:methanogenic corrinoid protein MtbC1